MLKRSAEQIEEVMDDLISEIEEGLLDGEFADLFDLSTDDGSGGFSDLSDGTFSDGTFSDGSDGGTFSDGTFSDGSGDGSQFSGSGDSSGDGSGDGSSTTRPTLSEEDKQLLRETLALAKELGMSI